MISKELTEEKATKTSLLTAGLIEKAPVAILKLKEKNGDPMLITIAEMSAVAFVSFNGAVLKGDKAAHARALSALYWRCEENPRKCPRTKSFPPGTPGGQKFLGSGKIKCRPRPPSPWRASGSRSRRCRRARSS